MVRISTSEMVPTVHVGNRITILTGAEMLCRKPAPFRRSGVHRNPPVADEIVPQVARQVCAAAHKVYRRRVDAAGWRVGVIVHLPRRILAHLESVFGNTKSSCLFVSLKAHAVRQSRIVNFGVAKQPHVYEFRSVHTHKYTTYLPEVNPYPYFFAKQILVACVADLKLKLFCKELNGKIETVSVVINFLCIHNLYPYC